MTHEQLLAAGYVQLANGQYYKAAAVPNHDPRPAGQLERHPGDGAVGTLRVQAAVGRRFLVHIESHRKRLLDQDNLCCKYLVDLCRYAGILPSDAPGTAEIKVSQQKVGPKEPERTVIEIYQL